MPHPIPFGVGRGKCALCGRYHGPPFECPARQHACSISNRSSFKGSDLTANISPAPSQSLVVMMGVCT